MAVAVVNYNDEATVPAGLGLDLLEVGFSTDTRVSVYVLGRKQKEKAKKIPTRLHTTRTHARTHAQLLYVQHFNLNPPLESTDRVSL